MENKKYLGVMLDCSRNAVVSVEGLKRFILKLEAMGYNCLQLYTEDTYEIEGEPLFGYRRGRYTKSEIAEIDEFAALHGIELMPCMQTLAHLNAIFRYGKYGEINDIADILLADDDRTYELIEKMIKTCSENYKTRNIHIGMDEAFLIGRGQYLNLHGLVDKSDIILRHLHKVVDICTKYGLKPMMWADMLYRLADGDAYYGCKSIPQEVLDKVPENIQLVYWDYYNEDEKLLDGMIEQSLAFNRNVWIAGGAWKWVGFQSINTKSMRQTEAFLKSAEKHNVGNILITMWGDNGDESCLYSVLPSLVYAAECAKGNYDIENAKAKFEELFGESFDDFMLCDIPFPNDGKFEGYSRGVKEMLYNDCFLALFDHAVMGDGSEDKVYAELAEKFDAASKRSHEFSYMFDSYAALCRVLSIKYSLGHFTREAYQKNDKKALADLSVKYGELECLLNDFVVKFEKMWFTDNKPHGFDIQDIRLGGVIQRVKSGKRRIDAYLNGEIDKIDELCEETVDYYTGGEPGRRGVGLINSYIHLVSANVM